MLLSDRTTHRGRPREPALSAAGRPCCPAARGQRSDRVHESDAELVAASGRRHACWPSPWTPCRRRWTVGLYRSPFTAGRTAAVAALSDLAAVGADPLGPAALGGPSRRRRTVSVQDGRRPRAADACAEAGTFVLGGDTNFGVRLSVGGHVGVGLVPDGGRPLGAWGCAPVTIVFASGPLGLGSARWPRPAGARLRRGRFGERRLSPAGHACASGRALRGIASACMDTSDGLVATLDQLARLNRVAVRIERPLDELLAPRVEAVRREAGVPRVRLSRRPPR